MHSVHFLKYSRADDQRSRRWSLRTKKIRVTDFSGHDGWIKGWNVLRNTFTGTEGGLVMGMDVRTRWSLNMVREEVFVLNCFEQVRGVLCTIALLRRIQGPNF